jgi:hypothetical protein
MIVMTCLTGGTGLLGIIMAMLSPMLFDAPGSEKIRALKFFFWCIFTYPLVCGMALGAGWMLYLNSNETAGVAAMFLPLVNWLAGGVIYTRLPHRFSQPRERQESDLPIV